MSGDLRPTANLRIVGGGAVALSALAFFLALVGAWLRPVWHDELYTLSLARLPLGELFSALVVDSGPPLHYLLCHLLFVLVGWPEGSFVGTLMVRMPSVLAFAILPLVASRVFPIGSRALPWAGVLTITWLPLLYFGTEARSYALLALVNAVAWIRGPEWIERGGPRIVAFGVAAACLPFLHYMGVASFVALPALALFVPSQRRRALAVTLATAALPALIWSPIMLGSPSASMGWLDTTAGPGRPGWSTLSVLAPAGPFPALFESSERPVAAWISLASLVLLVAGAVVGARVLGKRLAGESEQVAALIRLGIGLSPAVGLALAGLAGVPLYFAGRTESMVWTLGATMAAVAMLGLGRSARSAAGGTYALIGMVTIVMWLAELPSRPQGVGVEIGYELASRVEQGDRVVVAGLWQLEVQHGLAEANLGQPEKPQVKVETIPKSQSDHPGWLDRSTLSSPTLLDEARALRDASARDLSRIWLVWSPGLPFESSLFPVFSGWQRARVMSSPMIAVDLLVPPLHEISPRRDGELRK
jgi:mannosyltransferase